MDELDIRETAKAREEKALRFVEFEEIGDGKRRSVRECPVCGQTIKACDDGWLYSSIGSYHLKHLSEDEEEYLRSVAGEDERLWTNVQRAEQARKQKRAIYGDGF